MAASIIPKCGQKAVQLAAAQAREWECQPDCTRFADAFADSRGEMVDDLVIIGDRFDEDKDEALRQVEQLKERGGAHPLLSYRQG